MASQNHVDVKVSPATSGQKGCQVSPNNNLPPPFLSSQLHCGRAAPLTRAPGPRSCSCLNKLKPRGISKTDQSSWVDINKTTWPSSSQFWRQNLKRGRGTSTRFSSKDIQISRPFLDGFTWFKRHINTGTKTLLCILWPLSHISLFKAKGAFLCHGCVAVQKGEFRRHDGQCKFSNPESVFEGLVRLF